MKLLLVSNSFGVNLQTYAKEIAKSNNFDLDIYTLYIGGCSLDIHVKNIEENNKNYELFFNGSSTNKMISIKEALELDNWDIISLQQASHYSGDINTYYPYFEKVFNFIKLNKPESKIVFHKTWSYSGNNPYKFEEVLKWFPDFKFKTAKEMKNGIDFCCGKIAKEFNIDTIIRSGDVVELAMKKIGDCYDSQGFHMNCLGSYLIGLNLIKLLTGNKIMNLYQPNNLSKEICEKCVSFINEYF